MIVHQAAKQKLDPKEPRFLKQSMNRRAWICRIEADRGSIFHASFST